jgi:protein SCO1/2
LLRSISICTLSALLLATLASTPAAAFPSRSPSGENSSVVPTNEMPGPLRQVGYDQRLGEQVPLDLPFRDEAGRAVRLGQYFAPQSNRPVILVLAYYRCPMLCDLVIQGVTSTLKPLTFNPGEEFDVVVASFDPKDTPHKAAERKKTTLHDYGRTGHDAGWHFLTGPQPSIDALTRAVGFRYVYDKERDEFAHPAGMVILTPGGKVSRYLFGIDFPPRNVRFGIIESTDEKIGTAVDQLLLYCYHYNPAIGRYSAAALNILRLAAGATVIGLVALVVVLRRRESQQPRPAGV